MSASGPTFTNAAVAVSPKRARTVFATSSGGMSLVSAFSRNASPSCHAPKGSGRVGEVGAAGVGGTAFGPCGEAATGGGTGRTCAGATGTRRAGCGAKRRGSNWGAIVGARAGRAGAAARVGAADCGRGAGAGAEGGGGAGWMSQSMKAGAYSITQSRVDLGSAISSSLVPPSGANDLTTLTTSPSR